TLNPGIALLDVCGHSPELIALSGFRIVAIVHVFPCESSKGCARAMICQFLLLAPLQTPTHSDSLVLERRERAIKPEASQGRFHRGLDTVASAVINPDAEIKEVFLNGPAGVDRDIQAKRAAVVFTRLLLRRLREKIALPVQHKPPGAV